MAKGKNKVYVTIDWAGNPITTKGDGYILPRKAEMIINDKYYPNNQVGEWPCDPETGERLPIEEYEPIGLFPNWVYKIDQWFTDFFKSIFKNG